MKSGESWLVLVLFLFLFSSLLVTIAGAANNSSEDNLKKLNDSMKTGDIKEIINASRNSSEQLFGTFHNNSEALNTLPGLESMIGFIERLLAIMYNAADKIASYLP